MVRSESSSTIFIVKYVGEIRVRRRH